MIYDLQKASVWKRISAYLFDFILTSTAAVGFALLLSIILGYSAKSDNFDAYFTKYEQEYSVGKDYVIDFDIESSEYEELSDEQKETYDVAYKAMWQDKGFIKAFSMLINLAIIITVFGILLSYLIFEIAVPILFKNGQTLGKKIFGLCLVRVDCVKVTPLIVFVRTLLGKYTVETMLPLALVFMFFFGLGPLSLILLLILGIVQLSLFAFTKYHTAIHDKFAQTIVADMSSQMIFNNYEELLAYKKKIHAEESAEKAS